MRWLVSSFPDYLTSSSSICPMRIQTRGPDKKVSRQQASHLPSTRKFNKLDKPNPSIHFGLYGYTSDWDTHSVILLCRIRNAFSNLKNEIFKKIRGLSSLRNVEENINAGKSSYLVHHPRFRCVGLPKSLDCSLLWLICIFKSSLPTVVVVSCCNRLHVISFTRIVFDAYNSKSQGKSETNHRFQASKHSTLHRIAHPDR